MREAQKQSHELTILFNGHFRDFEEFLHGRGIKTIVYEPGLACSKVVLELELCMHAVAVHTPEDETKCADCGRIFGKPQEEDEVKFGV